MRTYLLYETQKNIFTKHKNASLRGDQNSFWRRLEIFTASSRCQKLENKIKTNQNKYKRQVLAHCYCTNRIILYDLIILLLSEVLRC